jgi:hypothetical protein
VVATADTTLASTATDLRGIRSMIPSAVRVPMNVPAPATPNTAA